MKKFFQFASLALLGLAILSGCKKDDGIDANTLLYDGQSYAITDAFQEYWGDYYDAGNVDVYVGFDGGTGPTIGFDCLLPAGNDRLVAHAYNYSADGSGEYVFGGEDACFHISMDDGNCILFTGGKVNVKLSGSTYTIDFTVNLDNGKTVKGNYTGTLPWVDETDN